MEEDYKEVYFGQYCVTCQHEKLLETDYPCRVCLDHPVNLYTHKPVKWEEKE